ncbi:hypothetical protein NQ317_014905 [Molorchus minor]|uniref:RAVE complex protein Rav1 C-terminal domain-containing protein n=1 Tax=Molorchus minor TaxID=1323400 RepID=A0ABQ9J8V4_9CUCU|nr:hypothetical protein NQ317_014905 [Molorchus minor]
MDAALYYMAMNKKSLVWGLYRSKRDEKMTTFFSNNFSEDRWRKAALKNAYALLGKQRFDHAAAFFLLAGNLNDAVEICLNRLQDIQLAIVIVRLYKGDGEELKQLLYKEILGCDENAHPDPFLRSMALWLLKDYRESLNTLLIGNAGTQHPAHDEEARETKEADPNVFNFYVYLRTHPLLVRQHLASYGTRKVWLPGGKQIVVDEWITPLERQLYFKTAHGHFRAGCPALALEVLSKLPYVVSDRFNQASIESTKENLLDKTDINTGMISWESKPEVNKSTDLDWGAPVTDLSDEEDKDSDDSDVGISINIGARKKSQQEEDDEVEGEEEYQQQIDVMAQQLKFVACLKILMEELSTLATGFEVDGGQLRYQLYIWLEQEVQALRKLCNYTTSDTADSSELEQTPEPENSHMEIANTKPTLHEILVQEKLDFEAKVQRAAKRKRWLRANETLLRTLLSYCSLHGATGGLASVKMELMLLLQELQQEKTHQQLLSPLPFPTSLPLLAASVASSKTVVADPIRYLQCLTHDMLQTIVEMQQPNTNQSQLLVIRDLAIALSACIYQSLCDSDTFKNAIEDSEIGATHLVGRRRRGSINEAQNIITLPSKWPGVTSLRSLLAREKDEDTPRLTVILCESFTAVYMALLLYGLVSHDYIILFHVTAYTFGQEEWGRMFGGGIKKLLRTASLSGNPNSNPQLMTQHSVQTPTEDVSGPSNWLSKQRFKLNTKLLGHQPLLMKEDKPTYREQFVPPEMSILAFLLQRPLLWTISKKPRRRRRRRFRWTCPSTTKIVNNEHSDPNSYSWLVLKLATLRIVQNRLNDFLAVVAGLELSELPVASPLIHSSLRRLTNWQESLKKELDMRQTPPEYIPGCFVENTTGPTIQKYRQILEPHNTPFSTKASAHPARQLWTYLVHQEACRDIFIRAVFGKRKSSGAMEDLSPQAEPMPNEPVRIIHKEQDSIAAFCLNQTLDVLKVNGGLIAVATPRELQGDGHLPPSGVACLVRRRMKHLQDTAVPPFLVIHNVSDKAKEAQPGSPEAGGASSQADVVPVCKLHRLIEIVSVSMLPNMKGIMMYLIFCFQKQVLKHKIDGIRRITAHPLLPLYLTGGQDGSVHLWEWGHQQPVAVPRPAGTYAKVTRVRFSQHGNKFGVGDSMEI